MNIFFLDQSPHRAAEDHCDKHVVKMILEYAQILSTAHRVADGVPIVQHRHVKGSLPPRYRNVKQWVLDNDTFNSKLYQVAHVNHPSVVWARQSAANYLWLADLLGWLLPEYTHRYGRVHKAQRDGLTDILCCYHPRSIPKDAPLTQPPLAMPEDCKIPGDSVESYRNYYTKYKSRFAKWTKRTPPQWYTDGVKLCQNISSETPTQMSSLNIA